MIISLHFRERLSGVLQVVQDELDNLVSTLRAWSNVEHNDDGSHSPNVGNILQFLAGANIGAGQVVYVSGGADQKAPGQAFLGDATSASKSTQAAVVGLATVAVAAGDYVKTRDRGIFSNLVGLTAGRAYYIGTTPGSLTATAPTNAVLVGLAISTTELLLLLRNPTTIAGEAVLTWTGTTSGTQNMQVTSVLSFATPGTYSITVSSAMTLSVVAAAGGGGGGGTTLKVGNSGGGGGGGGVTTGTSVALLSGVTYTLVVGAAGLGGTGAGTSGGNTTLAGSSALVTLGGGQGGTADTGAGTGTGGTATVGSNLVAGGNGGATVGAGTNGVAGAGAQAGGGGGGAGSGAPGTQVAGNGGGSGGAGAGGAVGVAGGNSTGGLTASVGGTVTDGTGPGGGGGAGGGALINGSRFGGAGGGGGGQPGDATTNSSGGNAQNGVAVFTFVSAP